MLLVRIIENKIKLMPILSKGYLGPAGLESPTGTGNRKKTTPQVTTSNNPRSSILPESVPDLVNGMKEKLLLRILHETPMEERQLDISVLVDQYQQILLSLTGKKEVSLATLVEGISLLTRTLQV